MFESSVFCHQICCHETVALLHKECCEAVLMSQCHLQQLLVWQQCDKERWSQFHHYQHLQAFFFNLCCLGQSSFLRTQYFTLTQYFHIEIEARCHLKIVTICLKFVSALLPVRELVRELPAVLCCACTNPPSRSLQCAYCMSCYIGHV